MVCSLSLCRASALLLEIPRLSQRSFRWSGCSTEGSCVYVKWCMSHVFRILCVFSVDPGQSVKSIGVGCLHIKHTNTKRRRALKGSACGGEASECCDKSCGCGWKCFYWDSRPIQQDRAERRIFLIVFSCPVPSFPFKAGTTMSFSYHRTPGMSQHPLFFLVLHLFTLTVQLYIFFILRSRKQKRKTHREFLTTPPYGHRNYIWV